MQLKTPRLRRAPGRLMTGAIAVSPPHVLKRHAHAGYESHDQKWSSWRESWQSRANDNQFAHPGNPAEWKEAYYESQLKLEMKARRNVRTWDYLSPTPARLLNLALDDFLPPDARPSHFLGWLGRRTAASAASDAAAAAAASSAAYSNSNSNDESNNSQDGPTIRRHPSGDRSLHSFSSNKTLIRRFQDGAMPLLGPPGLGGAPVLRGPPGLQGATPLPQGHHLVYFPPQLSDQELLPDGTDPAHWPGLPFTRRLWAGGAVTFNRGWERELRFNRLLCAMACDETVQHVELHPDNRHHQGGPEQQQQQTDRYHDGAPPGKVLVTLMRRYSFDGSRGPVITESRNLVFLRDHPPGEGPAPPRRSWSSTTTTTTGDEGAAATSPLTARRKPEYSFEMTPSRRLLFNFSALSHNAHLIHLDPAHARAEGHRDLLVHGPLTLILMLSALRAHLGPMGAAVRSIQYRNLAPLYVDEPLRVCVRRVDAVGIDKSTWSVWIETPDGGPAVKGTAVSYLVDQDMLFDRPRRHSQ